MTESSAAKALQMAFSDGAKRGKGVMSESESADDLLEIFAQALRESMPEASFTVGEIHAWAAAYQVQVGGLELPHILVNTYSLGRYIRAHHERLGFVNTGSYGNKQTYTLANEKEGGTL